MKLTTDKLKSLIKEVMEETKTGTQFTGSLDVTFKPEGGWIVNGVFNGQKIQIDSALVKSHKADTAQWENEPRFAMARELSGYFYKRGGEDSVSVRKQDLDGVDITINGKAV